MKKSSPENPSASGPEGDVIRLEAVRLAAVLTAAHIQSHDMKSDEISLFIGDLTTSIEGIIRRESPSADSPAVEIEESVCDEYIVCLEDGRKLKLLKRYLMTHFGMTPEQYREKWGLPLDYPMTAPNYSRERGRMARRIGLGKHGRSKK